MQNLHYFSKGLFLLLFLCSIYFFTQISISFTHPVVKRYTELAHTPKLILVLMQILIRSHTTLFSPTFLITAGRTAAAEEFCTPLQIVLLGRVLTSFLSESVYRDAVHVDTGAASANFNLDAQNSWNCFGSGSFRSRKGCCEVRNSKL